MKTIKGKDIKGYSFANGVHWHWGEEEIAIIDHYTGEIEWCVRKSSLPDEVIQHIRDLRPRAAGKWVIEAKRISHSVTQGSIDIQINGKSLITFGDDKKMVDGEWKSTIADEDLGGLVYALLYHPLDYAYHYSDRVKDFFKPNWRKDESKSVKTANKEEYSFVYLYMAIVAAYEKKYFTVKNCEAELEVTDSYGNDWVLLGENVTDDAIICKEITYLVYKMLTGNEPNYNMMGVSYLEDILELCKDDINYQIYNDYLQHEIQRIHTLQNL